MNLRQIIRENINSVILDSIITEAITNEVSKKMKRAAYHPNNRRQVQNLQQRKQQNARRPNQNTTVGQQQQNTQSTPSYGDTQNTYQAETPTEQPGYNTQDETTQDNTQGISPGQSTEAPKGETGQDNGQNTTQPQNAQPDAQQQQAAAYFKPFADELRQLIGTGFDATPVQNNQAAVEHINKLNPFVFYVIGAIESGNINSTASPATGGGSGGGRSNPYGKDKTDIALGAMNGAVGFASNQAEKIMGQGQHNPFNGVFKAFGDAHNQTSNSVSNYLNQRKFNNSWNNTQNGGEGGGLCLTYLMQNINDAGCYPQLHTEYAQINETYSGIFGATPNVSNCHDVLWNLAAAVSKYNNNQQQANQSNEAQVKKGDTVAPVETAQGEEMVDNTDTIETQTAERQLLEKFANKLNQIDGNGERLQQEAEYAQEHNLLHVRIFIEHVGDVAQKCVTAIESNKIRTSDKSTQEGVYPLTLIMGLSDYFSTNENTISFYDWIYRYYFEEEVDKNLPADTVAYKLFMTLYNLRKQMEAKGITDEY